MELKRLLVKYLLLVKEKVDKGMENVAIINSNIAFYYGKREKVANTYNMILEGQIEGIKIRHLVKVEEIIYYYSEEYEYPTFALFNEVEKEEGKAKGLFVYLPLNQFIDDIRKIPGFENINENDVKEAINTLNVKEELKKLEEEKEKEEERKEREEKKLLNKEYIAFIYKKQPIWSSIKGIEVSSYETALERINEYYVGKLVTELQIGRISIKEFDVKGAKIFMIDDRILGRMIIFREDDEWFMKFIKYVLNEIDSVIKEGYGIYKGFGNYEKKEVIDDKIIYYYKINKGNGSEKIGIAYSTRYEQGLREVKVIINGNKIEVLLTEFSSFIDAYIYYDMFRFVGKN